MRVALSLENLQSDFEAGHQTGDVVVHDAGEALETHERVWLRASNLAQLALNPLRFVNQPAAKLQIRAPNGPLKPEVYQDYPPEMVHFGSETTMNAAIGLHILNEDGWSNDVNWHQKVKIPLLEDPLLLELFGSYNPDLTPIMIAELASTFDGDYKYEDYARSYFEQVLSQFYPDHREILLPNSTAILNDTSQAQIRDYFRITAKNWQEMQTAGPDKVELTYRV